MTNNNIAKLLILILFVSLGSGFSLSSAQNVPGQGGSPGDDKLAAESAARDVLKKQIDDRSKELEKINEELAAVQKSLNTATSEKLSLQKQLSTLKYTANQLKLNIQADEIAIKKLALETQSLSFDIQDIETSIKDKKSAIGQVFREIQKGTQSSLLMIFLKNDSLADGILEAQSLNDLSAKLTVDVGSLHNLQEKLSGTLSDLNQKKKQTELHHENLKYRNLIIADQQNERQSLLAETKNKESLYQKQVEELRKLQQEIAEEVESLDAELRTKIDPSLLPKAGSGVLGLPVESNYLLTQKYGGTSFAKSAYPGKWHNGIDFRASVGSPIFAAESGVVAAVVNQDAYCYRGAYGRLIVINHNNNLTTLYAHLSRYIINKGDKVERGQLIGYAGSTGYATGPHLHFTVFAQPTFYMGQSRSCGSMPYGGDLNPERYL